MDNSNTTMTPPGTNRIDLPSLAMPRAPDSLTIWMRALFVVALVTGLFMLDRLTYVLLDLWLLDTLGLESVFWTNFKTGALLFLWGFAGPALGIAIPAYLNPVSSGWRRILTTTAVVAGLIGGYLLAKQYLLFLQLGGGVPVGESDPVFGNDLGFYMFSLPALWVIWTALIIPLVLGIMASVLCRLLCVDKGQSAQTDGIGKFSLWARTVATPYNLGSLTVLGILAAIGIWLARYDLLWKDNYSSAVYYGAEYVDVTGFFSYLNYYHVTAILILVFTGLAVYGLKLLGDDPSNEGDDRSRRLRTVGYGLAVIIALDFGFASGVGLRDVTRVSPNEPVIQLPYIKRHIDYTLRGFDLDNLETVNFVPYGEHDRIPDAGELLRTATLKNAPLWPGWVSYLERVLDPQHAQRVMLTGGDPTVYGPVLDIFRQEQKLRTYYDFLGIDTVRYTVDGEKQMFVSTVRELPLANPQPWVAWWGQRMLLYTHGHGLVMASTAGIRGEGEPVFAASGIPMQASAPELLPDNPSIYYGEGAGSGKNEVIGFSNARNISEFSYPTDEGREEVIYPPDIATGVQMDSLLKRLVVGWRSGVSFDIWFSGLLGSETRAHYHRRPLSRIDRIAPFLFLDSNPYAVVEGGRIKWIINAMTTSDRYPYSHFQDLGDKSNEQSLEPRRDRRVNYVRDSVKIVVDAYTGEVTLYQYADEPVANTWANIYPSLFTTAQEMPADIRNQLTFPQQMFHIQFDNIYYKYHMTDPLTFYNMEDMWDDADEVKGAILDEGKAITFSIEPRHWIGETGNVLPASSEATQFIVSKVFTNEQALNLRAIPLVYQDGDDYGRKIVLQVPKGHFSHGPEQADALIDQDPDVSEQIGWWNRRGAEVIRGHTSTLVMGREVLFVEPLFIRSRQNPVSQLKRVIVVFRGYVQQGATLAEALEGAIEKARRHQGENLPIAHNAPVLE